MPDARTNIIEHCYDIFEKAQRQAAAGVPDGPSFIGGFISCFGVLTGRVDIGLDQDAPLTQHFERIQRDLEDVRGKILTMSEAVNGARQ